MIHLHSLSNPDLKYIIVKGVDKYQVKPGSVRVGDTRVTFTALTVENSIENHTSSTTSFGYIKWTTYESLVIVNLDDVAAVEYERKEVSET